jgi:hypothetical protein
MEEGFSPVLVAPNAGACGSMRWTIGKGIQSREAFKIDRGRASRFGYSPTPCAGLHAR